MRKLTVLIAALMLLLGTVSNSHAVPMYYTFDGTVTMSGAEFGFADAGTLVAGAAVSYTILIDFDRQGSVLLTNADSTITDYSEPDFFYAEYISGTILPRPETGSCDPSYRTAMSVNFGTWEESQNQYSLAVSPTSFFTNQLVIEASSLTLSSTAVGRDDVQLGLDLANERFIVYSTLTLTSITSDAPLSSVPEPSTLLLLGSGLLGLVGLNRRRKA